MNWYIKCWKLFADFEGRARRSEFWWFVLLNFPIVIIVAILDQLFGTGHALTYLFIFLNLIPAMAVSIRRLHDVGRAWYWILATLVPIVGSIYLIYLFFLDSKPGPNRWGQNPKEEQV